MTQSSASMVRVRDLEPRDRIPAGTFLGPVTANDVLTVKSVQPGDRDKFAITFHGVGTFFLHGDAVVAVED